MSNKRQEFYVRLREKFTTKPEAKAWFRKWAADGQETPYGSVSMRAMAHHVSNVLEGMTEQEDDFIWMPYFNTAHGTDIYFATSDPVTEVE